MCEKPSRGFTLVEMVIVLSVVAILAAILVPVVGSSIQQARVARAAADVQAIGKALVQFHQDIGRWPSHNNSLGGTLTAFSLLRGPGELPAAAPATVSWNQAPAEDPAAFLTTNTYYGAWVGNQRRAQGLPVWNGPYVNEVRRDPWGDSYLVNVMYLPGGAAPAAANRVYVLSAGPDRTSDTSFATTADVRNDDIAFRLQ